MEDEVNVIPVVIGALGRVPKDQKKWLKELDLDRVAMQKAFLFGTPKILR